MWSDDPDRKQVAVSAVALRMAAADILRMNEAAGSSVFRTLQSVTKRMLWDDDKYRTLSMTRVVSMLT